MPLTIYLCMVTVSHIMVGLERMLDYRGVGLVRFHCMMTILSYITVESFVTKTQYSRIMFICPVMNYSFKPRQTRGKTSQLNFYFILLNLIPTHIHTHNSLLLAQEVHTAST